MLVKPLSAVATALLATVGQAHEANSQPDDVARTRISFHIGPGTVSESLRELAAQAGVHFLFDNDRAMDPNQWRTWNERPARAIEGSLTLDAALGQLLAGTGATYTPLNRTTISISLESRDEASPERRPGSIDVGVPEVLVRGKRTMNADSERTSSETQPYAVIDRHAIARAAPMSVDRLISRLLPASVSTDSASQIGTVNAGRSRIDLRGLGTKETLVLIDGRRASPLFISGSGMQADVSAIPAAAIERIEILPLTASGIYGGGATGGMVNIVLRRECRSAELSGNYGNSFPADAASHSLFFSYCGKSDSGRTQLQISGSTSRESELTNGDRNFMQRGRARILENNPGFFFDSMSPPLGAQTNLRTADGTGLAGPGTASFTTIPLGYHASQGATALLANAGHYDLGLAHTAQAGGGEGFTLWNGLETGYFDVMLTHEISPDVKSFGEFVGTRSEAWDHTNVGEYLGFNGMFIPAQAPGNVLGRDLFATVPAIGGDGELRDRLDSQRITAGINFKLPHSWNLGIEYTRAIFPFSWHQPVARSAAEAVASGALNVFADVNRDPPDLSSLETTLSTSDLQSRSDTATIRAAGTLFSRHAASLSLSAAAEFRNERFGGGTEYTSPVLGSEAPTPVTTLTKQARRIDTGYLEAHFAAGEVDVDGRSNVELAAGSMLNKLSRFELQIAGHIDHYRTDAAQPRIARGSEESLQRVKSTFTSVNPTIGMRVHTSWGITFRSTFATGFMPPSGDQLAPPAPTELPAGLLHDARRGGEAVDLASFWAGGNPNVEPEQSRSWSAGLVLDPPAAHGLHVALDYVQTAKKNSIVSPAEIAITDFAQYELDHPDRVLRTSAPAGDPFGVGRILSIDASDLNLSQSRLRAVDALIQYDVLDSPERSLRLEARATRQLAYETRTTASSPALDELALTADAPFKIGATVGVAFNYHAWELAWYTRYFGSYRVGSSDAVIADQGSAEVPHQTFHDASVRYRVPTHGNALLDSMAIQLSVQNVFNREPAFDAGQENYYSTLADPLLARYSLTLTKQF